MQNIGIVTFTRTLNDNFGTHLQCYALIQAIRQTAVQLQQQDKRPDAQVAVGLIPFHDQSAYKLAHDRAAGYLRSVPSTQLLTAQHKQQALQYFKQNLERLRKFEHSTQSLAHGFDSEHRPDKLICGSDCIWMFPEKGEFRLAGHLFGQIPQFADVPCYAYGPSFAQTHCTAANENYWKHKHDLRQLFTRFRRISLREHEWLDELNSMQLPCPPITTVLDPTLLLEPSAYEQFTAKPLVAEPYLLVYYFNQYYGATEYRILELVDTIAQYCKAHHCPEITVIDVSPSQWLASTPLVAERFKALRIKYKYLFAVAPSEFVNLAAHSTMTFCNSYHCVLFSLIMQRPFLYQHNDSNDPRFVELVRNFNIEPLLMHPKLAQYPDLLKDTVDLVLENYRTRVVPLREHSLAYIGQILTDKP